MRTTITLPTDLELKIREKADAIGQNFEEYALTLLTKALELPPLTFCEDESELLDVEYMMACGKEADPTITLEEVREGLSKIQGSMTEDFRKERDER